MSSDRIKWTHNSLSFIKGMLSNSVRVILAINWFVLFYRLLILKKKTVTIQKIKIIFMPKENLKYIDFSQTPLKPFVWQVGPTGQYVDFCWLCNIIVPVFFPVYAHMYLPSRIRITVCFFSYITMKSVFKMVLWFLYLWFVE